MGLRETIKKILREEFNQSIRRRVKFGEIDKFVKRNMVPNFKKDKPIEQSINSTIEGVVNDVMFGVFVDDDTQYHKLWHELGSFIRKKYTDDLRQYFEKRKKEVDHENNEMGYKYIFVKHDKPYLQGNWRGFKEGFDSFDDMITKYGGWIDVDWDEVKQKLDSIKNFPENTFTGRYNSRPLRISSVGDEGNSWGYNFSIIKQIPKENLDKVKDIQTEGLHDTSWENDMGEKYYISWDENYGKSFKLVKTPYGAQSGGKWEPNLVSIVTPENTNAWYEWEELSDEKLDMWKENWDNIQKTLGNHKYNQIIRNM